MTRRLYWASKNQHKILEARRILGHTLWEIVPCPQDIALPEEEEETFEGNALLKARALADRVNGPVVAEDSGLVVASLDGKPGVRSARFAGPGADDAQNIALLLRLLERFPAREQRKATFVAVVCLVEDGRERFFRGTADGYIARAPKGTGGFGYDPVFEPAGASRTFAELKPEEKDAVSHRSIALRRLAEYLASKG
mgnify:CR=1 FL=1